MNGNLERLVYLSLFTATFAASGVTHGWAHWAFVACSIVWWVAWAVGMISDGLAWLKRRLA